jgi:hypothetical protein
MEIASRTLDRRFGTSFERAQLAQRKNAPACEVRLDRLELTASGISEDLVLEIPGLRRKAKHFVRPQSPKDFVAYGRVTTIVGTNSIRKMTIQSDRRMRRLAHCKVTLIARDKTGLQPEDVLAVVNLLPDSRLVMAEVAFDFGWRSGVDGAFVRAHALFGKARPNQIGTRRCWDCWGARKAAKFVRSYFKQELGVHRLELQMNRRFLRRHGINDVSGLSRLVKVLPVHHIWFAKLDHKRVRRQLRNAGWSPRDRERITERVREAEGNLHDQLAVLRRKGSLENVRRVLVSMPVNKLVRQALRKWAKTWANADLEAAND